MFYEIRDVDKALAVFNATVNRLFDKHAHVTVKRVRGKPCQWITSNLKKLMSDRYRLLAKARKSGSDDVWNTYKTLRNSCNNQTRAAKRTYHCNFLHEHADNAKGFWKCIKSIFPTKRKSTAGNSNKNQTFVNKCSDYHQKAVSTLKNKAILLKNFVWRMNTSFRRRTNTVFKFDYVSTVFIQNQLKSLKRNKAAGADSFPPGMLKDCRMHISKPLHHIINLSLESGTVPSS